MATLNSIKYDRVESLNLSRNLPTAASNYSDLLAVVPSGEIWIPSYAVLNSHSFGTKPDLFQINVNIRSGSPTSFTAMNATGANVGAAVAATPFSIYEGGEIYSLLSGWANNQTVNISAYFLVYKCTI